MSLAGDLNAALRRIERHLADARPGTNDHARWSRQRDLALAEIREIESKPTPALIGGGHYGCSIDCTRDHRADAGAIG